MAAQAQALKSLKQQLSVLARSYAERSDVEFRAGNLCDSLSWMLRAYEVAPQEDSLRPSYVRLIGARGRGLSDVALRHDGPVIAAQFSPDGRTIVTASDDKTARLWDAAAGRELQRLKHDSSVRAASFSPDGRTVVTASSDGTARLWGIGPLSIPDTMDADRLRAWVLVRTSQDFTAEGALRPLGIEERDQQRRTYEAEGGDWQPSLDPQKWHLAKADEAEAGKAWFAAHFHLNRLLLTDPNNANLPPPPRRGGRTLESPLRPETTCWRGRPRCPAPPPAAPQLSGPWFATGRPTPSAVTTVSCGAVLFLRRICLTGIPVLRYGRRGRSRHEPPDRLATSPQPRGTPPMPRLLRRKARPAQHPLETYLREINDTPLLDAAAERQLAYRIEEGDTEARDHMVRANLRLVVNIARRYAGKGLGLQDLIEEGNLGLLRAVEGFDPSMNTRFSTYASYWIKQSIKRALINTGKTVRLPAYMVELLTKWRRATAQLQDELGRTPTQEEIARKLNLPKKKLAIIKKAIRIHNAASQADSEDDGWSLEEMLTDMRTKAPDTLMSDADDLRHVLELLDRMDTREAAVLRLRFGLDGEDPMTLKQIGDRLGLTRERVRQIECEALVKLRDGIEAA